MVGFLLVGAVLAYLELSVLIARALDAVARWHRNADKWGK